MKNFDGLSQDAEEGYVSCQNQRCSRSGQQETLTHDWHTVISCPNTGCPFTLRRAEFHEDHPHWPSCNYRIKLCTRCRKYLPVKDYRRHFEVCPGLAINCHVCGSSHARHMGAEHCIGCPAFQLRSLTDVHSNSSYCDNGLSRDDDATSFPLSPDQVSFSHEISGDRKPLAIRGDDMIPMATNRQQAQSIIRDQQHVVGVSQTQELDSELDQSRASVGQATPILRPVTLLPGDPGQASTFDLSGNVSIEERIQEEEIQSQQIFQQREEIRQDTEFHDHVNGEDRPRGPEARRKALYDAFTCAYYKIDRNGERFDVYPPSDNTTVI